MYVCMYVCIYIYVHIHIHIHIHIQKHIIHIHVYIYCVHAHIISVLFEPLPDCEGTAIINLFFLHHRLLPRGCHRKHSLCLLLTMLSGLQPSESTIQSPGYSGHEHYCLLLSARFDPGQITSSHPMKYS